MRTAAGSLCSALLASLFTFWLTQPDPAPSAFAQEGPALPGTSLGPGRDTPPDQPFRRNVTPDAPPPAFTPVTPDRPAPSSGPAAPTGPRSDPTLVPIRPRNAAPAATPALPEVPESPPAFRPGAPSLAPPGLAPPAGDTSPLAPTPEPAFSPARPAAAAGATFRPDADPELTPEEAINVAVYENCNRAVVNITSKGLPGERFLFMETPADGSGSGAVIDRSGHVLTNFHVVENAQQVEVTLFDGSTFDAAFVGADPVNDLAVLKIDAPADKLFPVEVGDSSRLKVGMRVFAIGNPFGLERTMTTGIVSSTNRSLQIRGNRSIKAIIQIDAAVNPGNSGGPLLDTRGQLIGVNTAIATRTGQSAGVGFAIPATLVRRVVPQLLKHGRVIRPEIGIQQVLETQEGLRIASLTPGGPAERAGLRGKQVVETRRGPFVTRKEDGTKADLIVAVDGEEVETADDFLGLIERKRPGDSIVLRVLRGGQPLEVSVTLAGPPLDGPPQGGPPANGPGPVQLTPPL